MLSIGRARHPSPCTSYYPSGFSVEFLNVGGWLSRGDLALESKAHFLAVAEHRLVPARARTVTTHLRKVRRSPVWAPSCQDVTPGSHAGVGVISLHGASLSLPTLFDPSFKEFFRIGRAMRVVLPVGNGGIAHLFVIYGYQGAESDPEKLQLSEHLFAAVLAEANMCCAGQPVILVGDFNADPTVIPSLAKGIMNGHWIDVEQFVPHFAVYAEFSLSLHGMPLSIGLGFIHPCGQLVGLIVQIAPDDLRHMRFRISGTFTSKKSASYLGRLGSNSFIACNSPDVDASWLLWS